MEIGTGAVPRERPNFQCWNFVTPSSGLRIFQGIGALSALFLIGSVDAHFSPTYAALLACSLASIGSPTLVLAFSFNLQRTTETFDWILWETLYTGSFSFLFLINSITMSYSGIRWEHTAWYLAAVVCLLVMGAFVIDTFLSVRLLLNYPAARHSQDRPLPQRTDRVEEKE